MQHSRKKIGVVECRCEEGPAKVDVQGCCERCNAQLEGLEDLREQGVESGDGACEDAFQKWIKRNPRELLASI